MYVSAFLKKKIGFACTFLIAFQLSGDFSYSLSRRTLICLSDMNVKLYDNLAAVFIFERVILIANELIINDKNNDLHEKLNLL